MQAPGLSVRLLVLLLTALPVFAAPGSLRPRGVDETWQRPQSSPVQEVLGRVFGRGDKAGFDYIVTLTDGSATRERISRN